MTRPALPVKLTRELGELLEQRLARLARAVAKQTKTRLTSPKLSDAVPLTLALPDIISQLSVLTGAEQAELARIGKSLVRHGLEQALKQSPVFSGPIPPGQQELFNTLYADWLKSTADLMTTLPKDSLEQIAQVIVQNPDATPAELGALLQERLKVGAYEARNIARQQSDMLAAQSLQARHKSVGVTSYRWRNVGDRRVRKLHQQREGREFSYAEPPEDGHPGEPWGCRCYAEPVIQGYEAGVTEKLYTFEPRRDPTPHGADPLGFLSPPPSWPTRRAA